MRVGHRPVFGPQSLRQPPSEAERQSQRHNVNLNKRCGKVLKLIFTCNPIKPIVAVATTERLNKLWKDRGQLVFKRPWRIDHDQAATAERTLRWRGANRQLCSQDAGNAAALEPACKRIRLLPTLDRVPEEVDAARPFAVRGLEPMGQAREVLCFLKWRINHNNAAALKRWHIR